MEPVFTIFNPLSGKRIEIFENGHVDGLDVGDVIINRIPLIRLEEKKRAGELRDNGLV